MKIISTEEEKQELRHDAKNVAKTRREKIGYGHGVYLVGRGKEIKGSYYLRKVRPVRSQTDQLMILKGSQRKRKRSKVFLKGR